ncbi:MAG: TIGR02281 family clan AA aspartic protease [Oceanicoccus sp.]
MLIQHFSLSKCVSRCLLVMLVFLASPAKSMEIQAQALLKDMVVIVVDGTRRVIKAGNRSPEGVLLVTSDPRRAIVEINGQRQQLTLSTRISSDFVIKDRLEVTIPRNQANQYVTSATINGRRVKVLVDTGATFVALSSQQAQQLGIDYLQGHATTVVTASGRANAYQIKLRSVMIGGINAEVVPAVIVEGNYPQIVLLGMSYLDHVDMHEQNGVLLLQSKL